MLLYKTADSGFKTTKRAVFAYFFSPGAEHLVILILHILSSAWWEERLNYFQDQKSGIWFIYKIKTNYSLQMLLFLKIFEKIALYSMIF